jgi:hypothetical protein
VNDVEMVCLVRLVGSDRGQPTISGSLVMFLAFVVPVGTGRRVTAMDCMLCVVLSALCCCRVFCYFGGNTHWGLSSLFRPSCANSGPMAEYLEGREDVFHGCRDDIVEPYRSNEAIR